MIGLSTFNAFKSSRVVEGAHELSNGELQELHGALFNMLGDIDRACRLIGAKYMLAYGSCLGSVRHRGFIPWDDDLDIAMLRGDFRLFEALFDEVLGVGYVLQVPGKTPGYDLAFPRIRKRGTVLKNRDDFFNTGECGVYIDLFIFESIPDNRLVRAFHGFVSLGLGFGYSCRRFAKYGGYYLRLVEGDSEIERVFKFKISVGRLLSFLSVEDWTLAWSKWNSLCRNSNSCCLTIPAGPRHYFREMQYRNDIFPYIKSSFENMDAPIPLEPQKYLKKLYGDSFMQLQPEEERERHIVLEFDLNSDTK